MTCAERERGEGELPDQVTAELHFARQMGISQEGWSSASRLSARQVVERGQRRSSSGEALRDVFFQRRRLQVTETRMNQLHQGNAFIGSYD